jgi:hypothetical protein
VRFSVLVNGTPSGFFNSSWGLRQGDHLSPLLFVVVMEALSQMLSAALDQGNLTGFSVGSREPEALVVNHLMFADDTLIFCGAQEEQIRHLRCIFLCFEVASSLRINLGKSEIVPIGAVEDVEGLAHLLGCRVASLPMTYLGLPLGVSYKYVSIWNGVIEKMERRLAGWKRMYLSKGGWLTLLKSTLSNLPTYLLSLFPIPVRVANRLDNIRKAFLWGGIEDEAKFHLVKWNRICTSLHSGGLGVHNFIQFNRALLGKLLWRYGREREALWRLVIDAKFESLKGAWCSKEVSGSFGVGVWKHIRRGWRSFVILFVLRWGMGHILVSGIIGGVGIDL